MQAIVGSLVAKTLSSASAAGISGAQRVAPPPVAFDVFSVQARLLLWLRAQVALAQLLHAVMQMGASDGDRTAVAHKVHAPCHLPLPLQACTNTIMAHFAGMLFR